MKDRKIIEYEKNYERMKKGFENEKNQFVEEIEIEKEKVLQLQKTEI